ncbi:41980_t:CDS:1, partial [Gigaspora margarita]
AQVTTEQLTENNKAGACSCTNKKRKVEGSKEEEEDKKNGKTQNRGPT